MDFDENFERTTKIKNLDLDYTRAVYIDKSKNKLFMPIVKGYSLDRQERYVSDFPKIKEVHGGIKFNLARKYPSENPNNCQGGCKCGIGFRCGSTKSVTIKTEHKVNFDFIDREVVAKQYIDFENDYYILEFVTIIDWDLLGNE